MSSASTYPARLLGRTLGQLSPNRITALAYHRIAPADLSDAPGSRLNWSALQPVFRQHLEILADTTNVVRTSALAAWVRGDAALPKNASVITFDDGYRDNLTHALPVLKELGVPATIYLATHHIGSQTPLYWDLATYAFQHAKLGRYALPVLGEQRLDAGSVSRVARQWVSAVKLSPPQARDKLTQELVQALGVNVSSDAFEGLYLSWDDVRDMRSDRIEFGAHTVTHPLLSTLSDPESQKEISDSKQHIETELGESVSSFAYPNGLPGDFTDQHVGMLKEAGLDMAFTLSAGPTTRAAVKADPYRVARVYIGLKDTPIRFTLKLWGAARLHKQRHRR
jgi:peptidoglycan/xylan/chitin deacetylase (PgdA/CDA1 family)